MSTEPRPAECNITSHDCRWPRGRQAHHRHGGPSVTGRRLQSEAMTTPIKPLPRAIERWMTRVAALRWGDAVIAWVIVWVLLVAALGDAAGLPAALGAAAI